MLRNPLKNRVDATLVVYDAIRKMKEYPLSSDDCRKRAEEHFDKDKCFEKYIQLYESLISKENDTK